MAIVKQLCPLSWEKLYSERNAGFQAVDPRQLFRLKKELQATGQRKHPGSRQTKKAMEHVINGHPGMDDPQVAAARG